MTPQEKRAAAGVPVMLSAAAGLAIAGGHGGIRVGGVPVYAACIAIAFVMQWLAFVPAYLRRTEKFYDLTGSLTYIVTTVTAVALSPTVDSRSVLLLALISAWALRLGTFLYRRIKADGFDRRFADIKRSLPRFLAAWTLQGLWVSLSLAAALAAITSSSRKEVGVFALIGTLTWLIGFGVEAVADRQKRRFRADAANQERFISTGLWAWSRHPNYFGEILVWIGIALIAIPNLAGWQWVTLISPLFVIFLLTRISGIPPLESYAEDRWGGRDDYEMYKRKTPALILRPPR